MFRWKHAILLVILLLVCLRLINLDITARFTQDESSDLLRMEQYWKTKKITLVGPISTDNTKVFGSLTYYMLMPFAALLKFDPVGPAYGTAFWGLLTAIILIFIVKKVNKTLLPFAVILIMVWYPLLESSRWAWNPHLIPFWVAAGLLLLHTKYPSLWQYLLAGMCFGLTIHHHYIALFTTLVFCLIYGYRLVRGGNKKAALLLVAGYVLSLLPFIIFDLRHPPGLFIGKYLMSGAIPHVDTSATIIGIISRLFRSVYIAGLTVTRLPFFAVVSLALTSLTALFDARSKRKYLWLLIPVMVQLLPGLILTNYETRYFLPAVGFYLFWLIQPRNGRPLVVQKALLSTLIVGSLLTLPNQITRPEVQPSIRVIREVTDTIAKLNQQQPIKNPNITTTNSPDGDLLALKYRDVLTLKNVTMKASSEYDVSENLFVISTADISAVRIDKSVPLQIFKNAKLKGTYPTKKSNWVLYWLGYE